MTTDAPINNPHTPHRSGGIPQATSSAKSRTSGVQSQNTQDPQQAVDRAVDQILIKAKSQLEENEVPEVIRILEKLVLSQPMNVRTRRRCFRGLVEVCGKYGVLPDSHTIPASKIRVVGDDYISSTEFSEVWEGEYKEGGEAKRVAIKVVRYLDPDKAQKLRRDFCREVIIWKRLSHENILPLIGATMDGGGFRMVSPWMKNGNIIMFLRENYETSANPLKLLVDVALGVQYLHSMDLAHGDIKGGNILITTDIRGLLTDVGLTRVAGDFNSVTAANTTSMTVSANGNCTVRWTPLELLDPERMGYKKSSGPTKKSDIYSLAMTIYEVLTDRVPFYDYTDLTAMFEITQGARPKKPAFNITRGYTQELWDMGSSCWEADPVKRPGIDHVLCILETAAGQWKPRSGGFSALTRRDDWSTTVSEWASGHGPEISGPVAGDRDSGPDPSDTQQENTVPTLDETVDQILAKTKSSLEEDEARGVVEALEKNLKSCHDMSAETRKRCFQGLVEICEQYSILPDSYIIPEPKLQKQGNFPVSSGGSSAVWSGVYMEDHDGDRRCVAVKVMRYSRHSSVQKIRKSFCREVVIWGCLSHPNILELLGVTMEGEYSMVSPWMENEEIIKFLRRNSQANPLKLLADAARGLEYLHNMGFTHGDVKGGNILISKEERACLADFRLTRPAGDLGPPLSSSDTARVGGAGTIRWCPLEVLDPKGPGVTKGSDIYSMAMTIYEVLTDRMPFYEYTGPAAVFQIARGERPKKPDFTMTRGYTQELWDMGMSCWDADPTKRPTIDHVLNTLEVTAQPWRPISPHDGHGATVSEGGGTDHTSRAAARDRDSRSTPLGVQQQNAQDAQTSLDQAVDQILMKVTSPLKESEVPGVVKVLEWMLEPNMNVRTQRRCFQGLVEVCGKHGVLPDSHTIPVSKIKMLDDTPVSAAEFTEVWLGTFREDEGDDEGTFVRIKVVRYLDPDKAQNLKRDFCREVIIWKGLSHPNILPLLGATMDGGKCRMVSPWVGDKNIVEFLRENLETNPLKLLADAARGLQYLHSMDLAHGDLRGRNILITDGESACLADFGHTRDVGGLDPLASSDTSHVGGLGTIRWRPLEVLDPKGPGSTKESDVYSMAMTIYEVLMDRVPFYEYNDFAATLQAARGQWPRKPDPATTRGYSDGLWDMGVSCWDMDPAKRPTIDHVLSTLEIAAEQREPKHEELSPLTPSNQDSTPDPVTPADEATEGQSGKELGSALLRTRSPDGQQMDINDKSRLEPPNIPRPTTYGACWSRPAL